MDHFLSIYQSKAAAYHAMVAREDVDGNLLQVLRSKVAFEGKRVLDVGSGTGRLPLLLHPHNVSLTALDLHFAMLVEQQAQRAKMDGAWTLLQGDAEQLPFDNGAFEIVLAGWALGHFNGWFGDAWETHLTQAVGELHRVVEQPAGHIIIMETMGTGFLEPQAPVPELARYYAWLENEWGFERTVLQTDYLFDDIDSAVAHTSFFFGDELAAQIRANGWQRLPEWTGLWHKQR